MSGHSVITVVLIRARQQKSKEEEVKEVTSCDDKNERLESHEEGVMSQEV